MSRSHRTLSIAQNRQIAFHSNLNPKMDPQDDENLLKVKSVLRGSPASGCGVIAVGDVIVAVDGEDMYGSSLAGVRQDPRYTINSSQHGLRK